MRILVVEDDERVADYIAKGLRENGHDAAVCGDGQEGLNRASTLAHDALIVDRMLPSLDGLTLIRYLREAGHAVPVLILSALGDVDDRVNGLRAGGDDYLVKPFALAELLARIEAMGRRNQAQPQTTLTAGDLEVDLLARTVRRGGKEITLYAREFQLLEYLMRHKGRVVTRAMLLEHVWDYHFDPQTNVIDVHMSRLRSKVDKGFDRPLIQTVRGTGYRVD